MRSAVRCLALALVAGLASLFSLTLQDAVTSVSVVPNGPHSNHRSTGQ